MRSTVTHVRGRVGLIRKGSGQIVATAVISDCKGPFDREEMIAHVEKHAIPEELVLSGSVDKWCYAWVITGIIPLKNPVYYLHPKGAVIWVKFDRDTAKALVRESAQDGALRTVAATAVRKAELETSNPVKWTQHKPISFEGRNDSHNDSHGAVPFSKDGSFFGPHLSDRGFFQVGAKGEEVKYRNYRDALSALRDMRTARWRRPNRKGNWGIVTAIQWADSD